VLRAFDQPDPDADPQAGTETELLQTGYRYGLSLTGRHHDAQDLVQQAAFRLYRRYGGIKNRSLLFTTIRNLFYDQLRRSQVVNFDSLDDEESRIVEVPGATSVQGYGDLETLLKQLEPAERELIFLHYVQGYTTREISKLVERNRNTVLSLLSRARKKLEVFLEEKNESGSDEPGNQAQGSKVS